MELQEKDSADARARHRVTYGHYFFQVDEDQEQNHK
jgi:hypothetical protein